MSRRIRIMQIAAAGIFVLAIGGIIDRHLLPQKAAQARPAPTVTVTFTPLPEVVERMPAECDATLRGAASAAMFTLASADALDTRPTDAQIGDVVEAWRMIVEACS